MSPNWTCSCSSWSREENKAFENALAIHSDETNPIVKIAAAVPGRTLEEVKNHFEALVADVDAIESDLVPVPHYEDSLNKSTKRRTTIDRKQKQLRTGQNESSHRERLPRLYQGRRKAQTWSKDEHRLFLLGLAKFGRGDWRSISRLCVRSKTPSQVASHAQKFFQRMEMPDKEKARLSDYGVTILDDGKIITQQMPTTENLAGTIANGSNTPPATTGIDLQIDNELNLSFPQSPLFEVRTEAGDAEEFLHSMFDCFQDDPPEQWPSIEENVAAAGISLGSPLITGCEVISAPKESAGKEVVASPGEWSCEHDSSTPEAPTPAQVTGNDGVAAGGSGVKSWERSSPNHPDGKDGVGGSGVDFWDFSSPDCACGNGEVGGSGVDFCEFSSSPYCACGNGGVDFGEFSSSPCAPDFGASTSEFAGQPVDTAVAACAPSPNPSEFNLYSPHMQADFPSPPEDIATLVP